MRDKRANPAARRAFGGGRSRYVVSSMRLAETRAQSFMKCDDARRSTSCTSAGVRFRLAVLLLCLPALALAQETREDEIAAAQREKAADLSPHRPHWAEEMLLHARQTLVEQPSGFYPYFASVYSGGGFTLGEGYRHYTGDRTHWSIAGLYSAKNYKLIEASESSLGHWSGRLDLLANAGWRDATEVAYHGIGIDSPEENSAFRMQQGYGGGGATIRPLKFLELTGVASYENYTIKDPSNASPSAETLDPSLAPGAGVDPIYVHTTIRAAFDWRPAADYARRGGLYQIARHHYADRDDTYSFDRVDAEVVQHVPILRENWVLSFHGRLESTLGDDSQVPYFLLPALGSGSTLRGYGSWRFRDRHAMLVTGEWRWIASRLALDMALFYDTGMVAPTFDAISTRSFVSNYGIGARFHGPARTPLRVELARSREGVHVVFAASAAF